MHERTLREARAAAALSHPSVVQVYDVVTEDGRPWIVMELLQARSLSEIIISDGPLSGRAVAKIGIALLGALEVAHAAGVLHRDVKPANVLICADGRCVLTDFGVARMPSESNLTQPGMVLGSPHFISPERAIGATFGPPSDLFSLGVTLYTAIEGRPPFDKGDPFETMRAIVEDEPLPPVRAGALAPVLMSACWTRTRPSAGRQRGPQRAARLDVAGQPGRRARVAPPRQAVGGRALLADGETARRPASGRGVRSRRSAGPHRRLATEAGLGLPAGARIPAHRSARPTPARRTARRRRIGARHATRRSARPPPAGWKRPRPAWPACSARIKTWPPAAQIGVPGGIAVADRR